MSISAPLRALCVVVLSCGLFLRTAHALVSLNDGTDKIFVSGTFTMGYSTNITASAQQIGDTTYAASGAIEYQRRAGLIAVNANVSFSLTDYFKNRTYDSLNPAFGVEFDKTTGRTTGTLNLNAQRSSQADAAANTRDISWNYSAGLNLHYPVIERYSFTASFGYGLLDFIDKGNLPLVNLSTYTATLGLFYVLTDDRDLFADYRYRYEQTSASEGSLDNSLSLGVSGKIIWEINGSLSVGYQIRTPRGMPADGLPQEAEHAITAAASASWAMNRKTTFSASLSRDFSTTSLGATTDTTAATLDLKYAYNAKLAPGAGIGGGESDFLGPLGLLAGTNVERRDYYITWNASISYAWFGARLGSSLSYAHFHNWSNLGLASFSSDSLSLSLSTRW